MRPTRSLWVNLGPLAFPQPTITLANTAKLPWTDSTDWDSYRLWTWHDGFMTVERQFEATFH